MRAHRPFVSRPAADWRDGRLENGLPVRLLHCPGLRHGAAAIRIAAGSHDAPAAYPGLAHFLEHLAFRGSARHGEGLMAYAQGHGGEVNARTLARDTCFFFQVPPDALGTGLAQLCDLLAWPDLPLSAQQGEREVLEAEFQARGRDGDTLMDAALAQAAASDHPVFGFHAGNRRTLAVEQPAFQRALRQYHRRFYHAGAARLAVAGPQPLDELLALAERLAALPGGPGISPAAAPPLALRPASLRVGLDGGLPRLTLAHALDGLAPVMDDALQVFAAALQDEASGLLAELLRFGWCESARVRVPYRHAGQALVAVEFELTQAGVAARSQVAALFRQWLAWARRREWDVYCDERHEIDGRRRSRASALERVRDCVERWPADDSPAAGVVVHDLLGRLAEAAPAVLLGDTAPVAPLPTPGFPLRVRHEPLPEAASPVAVPEWRPPPANPFLALEKGPPGAVFVQWPALAFLRIRGSWEGLAAAVETVRRQAGEAGLDVTVERRGEAVLFAVNGPCTLIPACLEAMGRRLAAPDEAAWAQGLQRERAQRRRAAGLILLRQLLERLPDVLAARTAIEERGPGRDSQGLDGPGIARSWAGSRQDIRRASFAVGQDIGFQQAVEQALTHWPGRPAGVSARTGSALPAGHDWQRHPCRAGDEALLLFCPQPPGAEGEAAWRWLGALLAEPFHRRLRVELQLGYALFCGYRTVGDRGGLLFGVQSPKASAARLMAHVETLLHDGATVVAKAPVNAAQRLAGQLEQEKTDVARWAWQAWRRHSGQPDARAVAQALRDLSPSALAGWHAALCDARHGWLAIATGLPEDARWTVR